MAQFPSSKNELPLIFNLYSNLIQTKNYENSKSGDPSLLFDKYYSINSELFKLIYDDTNSDYFEGNFYNPRLYYYGNLTRKKKNYQLIYLLYYYSILLNNKDQLPYPNFLFIHDIIRQHFGGFRTAITKGDIEKYRKKNDKENKDKEAKEDKENKDKEAKEDKDKEKDAVIQYKSAILNNEVDLQCSCNLVSIFSNEQNNPPKNNLYYGNSYIIRDTMPGRSNYYYIDSIYDVTNELITQFEKEKMKTKRQEKLNNGIYTVIIHQIKDDKKLELPVNGDSIRVSFPLEIIIYKKGASKKEMIDGSAFVFNFSAAKEQQKEFFINNYNEIKEDFTQFLSLGEHDRELLNFAITTKDNNNNNNDNDEEDQNDNQEEDEDEKKKNKENRKDFEFYELEKIPNQIDVPESLSKASIKSNTIALRYTILNYYSQIIEFIMINYNNSREGAFSSTSTNNCWNISLSSKNENQNIYSRQIIRPSRSMKTECKFKFINSILKSEKKGKTTITITFNRFEQQKFMEQFDDKTPNNKDPSATKARPLFIQFMDQVDSHSISKLKVQGQTPFKCELAGENAIDAGGPGRELFSSLIIEMMNEHLGIFTYNSNRRHGIKFTNQEDLIPNKYLIGEVYRYDEEKKTDDDYFQEDNLTLRFKYAGVLIGICIVSELPQPMKLSSFIWEYLSKGKVSIETVYENDNNFKELITKAEKIQKIINTMNDEEFKMKFQHMFNIRDSFDREVELIVSGSTKEVTRNNLNEFIELAKNYRIHEFDQELKEMKEGFDKIMCYKEITGILNSEELKLLACGESECTIEQMKKVIIVSVNERTLSEEEKANHVKMFWNVMERFTAEERMLFIKFSSGNLGLPAPGLRWERDLRVAIMGRDFKEELPIAHTCASLVDIPFFTTEDELSKKLKIAINYSGLITDSVENTGAVSEFL